MVLHSKVLDLWQYFLTWQNVLLLHAVIGMLVREWYHLASFNSQLHSACSVPVPVLVPEDTDMKKTLSWTNLQHSFGFEILHNSFNIQMESWFVAVEGKGFVCFDKEDIIRAFWFDCLTFFLSHFTSEQWLSMQKSDRLEICNVSY